MKAKRTKSTLFESAMNKLNKELNESRKEVTVEGLSAWLEEQADYMMEHSDEGWSCKYVFDENYIAVLAWVDGYDEFDEREDGKYGDGTHRIEYSVRYNDNQMFYDDSEYAGDGGSAIGDNFDEVAKELIAEYERLKKGRKTVNTEIYSLCQRFYQVATDAAASASREWGPHDGDEEEDTDIDADGSVWVEVSGTKHGNSDEKISESFYLGEWDGGSVEVAEYCEENFEHYDLRVEFKSDMDEDWLVTIENGEIIEHDDEEE